MPLIIAAIVLAMSAFAVARETSHDNPRSVTEAYVAAALSGKVDDAVAIALADTTASDQKQVKELNAFIEAETLKIPIVWVGEKRGQALAVTEQVKLTEADTDGPDTGYLVFLLVKSQGKWLVDDIDFNTEERAKRQVEDFKKKNLDARSLPGKSKHELQVPCTWNYPAHGTLPGLASGMRSEERRVGKECA